MAPVTKDLGNTRPLGRARASARTDETEGIGATGRPFAAVNDADYPIPAKMKPAMYGLWATDNFFSGLANHGAI